MSEKQLVKMAQPASNGHPRGTNNPPKVVKNEQRSQRGKNGSRSKEKTNGHSAEDEDSGTGKQQKGHRNSKKGRLMNDFVNFQHYRPQLQPARFNHRRTNRPSCDYVKEDYVHVSCQFVVQERDWQSLTVVDSTVDWHDIIQVKLPCEELSSCPICLYPPVCPLTPVCGHAMCYSCALRFMDNCPGGDCPICHKPGLIVAEFKPLKTFQRHKFVVGDEIVFKLVSRYRDSRIVCPVNEDLVTNSIPNISSEWGSRFCNVVTASPSQILQAVYLAQEEELQTQLALVEESDKESEPYILRALSELQVKKAECFEQIENMKDTSQNQGEEAPSSNGKKVYFYQAEDGQPIFIHPLNSRCLIQEYGSIEASIPEISCKIVAMEYYTQSPDLRSRYRYFSHLPLGCSFILCEVDIVPFISAETYDLFKDGIEKRQRARSSKEQKEDAYSRKLAEKEVTYHCSAYLPKYTEITKPAMDHYKTSESYDLLVSSPSSPTGSNPLSFAEKLRQGASKPTPWMKSPVPDQRFRINSTSSDISVDSEATPAPSFQTSFNASLNDAFANLEIPQSPVAPTHGKKKKKGKGKTISLTGGARRG